MGIQRQLLVLAVAATMATAAACSMSGGETQATPTGTVAPSAAASTPDAPSEPPITETPTDDASPVKAVYEDYWKDYTDEAATALELTEEAWLSRTLAMNDYVEAIGETVRTAMESLEGSADEYMPSVFGILEESRQSGWQEQIDLLLEFAAGARARGLKGQESAILVTVASIHSIREASHECLDRASEDFTGPALRALADSNSCAALREELESTNKIMPFLKVVLLKEVVED